MASAPRLGWALAWGVAAALALPLAAAPAQAAGGRFHGVVTQVHDGDSLWVRPDAGGPPRRVRLQGIDAPEVCQAHGLAARDALAARVLGQRVSVRARQRDDHGRLLGRLAGAGEADIGAWMVTQGHAWSYRFRGSTGPYAAQQAQAQQARRGLWAQPGAVEPRQFRKRHGRCEPTHDDPRAAARPRHRP